MKKFYKLSGIIWILISISAPAQKKYTVSGYITDAESGEQLISANVYDFESGAGTISNNYGFYSLTLPEGKASLEYSYIGYEDYSTDITLTKDTLINVRLHPGNELEEVTLTASRKAKIQKKTQMSQIDIPVKGIEKIPSLLGEVDILKVLQLLPGVQGGTEGFNGLYIRGGSPDQNLIILDGVPVYNISHLFGFLSVFNSDAIKKVTLTKGGFPARYGGRLSSVIEINMKEGNNKTFHGAGAIGLLTSRLTLEAPIVKDKTSFMISGRRNYIDLILKPIIKKVNQNSPTNTQIRAYFYDLNAKINHKFNDKHTLYASAYLGSDVFGAKVKDSYSNGYFSTDSGIDWGNIISALRWNYRISPKLFTNTTVTYSRFQFNFKAIEENMQDDITEKFQAHYLSGIFDWAGKIDADYIPNPTHYFRFGIGETYHTYNPGALSISGNATEDDFHIQQTKRYSHEFYSYAEDDISLGALKMNLGIRLSGFRVKNTQYWYPQPRIGLRYMLNNDWSIKASYASMAQYINLLTNESIGLPTDLWVPSTERIKPQTSRQIAFGTATTLDKGLEFSTEIYYKKMHNVISYKEGANFYSTENNWEDKITQGDGTSYGIEFLLQKKQGNTTGWLGYTLSKNFRQFDDINNGKEFPYKFDRRHDVKITVSHRFNDRISLSGTWVYGTGNAITLTEATYINDYESGEWGNYYQQVSISGEKNTFRMPAYHRLDLGITFHKKKKWGERYWNLGVYNVYNRRNPFYIYLSRDYEQNKNVYKQISLIPVIPSVSYSFKF